MTPGEQEELLAAYDELERQYDLQQALAEAQGKSSNLWRDRYLTLVMKIDMGVGHSEQQILEKAGQLITLAERREIK